MNYSDYAEAMKNVEISEKLKFVPAVLWPHSDHVPLALASLGAFAGPVVRVPAWTRLYSNSGLVPVIGFSKDCFAGNEALTDILLPAGIRRLPAGAFAGCTGLRNITIPARVRTIPAGTFAGCSALENIYYEGTPEEWKQVQIVHSKHEIEFGRPLPGTPVSEILAERLVHVPGNEAVFAANIHFRCAPGEAVREDFVIRLNGRDVTDIFRRV